MSPTLLETCLGLSGSFEGGNGAPRYDLLTGNFDGQGISCGCLQWCAGQGSLQTLLKNTIGDYPVADDDYKPLWALKDMAPAQAVAYAVEQWVDPASPQKNLTPEAVALWSALLSTPQCIQAQLGLAQDILTSALAEANRFLPWLSPVDDNLRIAAFFFDVHVQQGSMSKKQPDGSHKPDVLTDPSQATGQRAVDLATAKGMTKTATAWQQVLDSGDTLANVLLHYAFERSLLGNLTYQWDTVSRRGTLACRQGSIHGKWFDLGETLS